MPNNTVPISFNLSGLLKRLNYDFTIEGLGGNWPATITPASGGFTAAAKTAEIPAAVSFCATTGVCLGDTDILPYDMAKKCSFDKSQIFTFVRMKASLSDDPTTFVYSDPVYVTCETCLPDAAATLPGTVLLSNRTNTHEFTTFITGLVPKETYTFDYSAIQANWPAKIYPISGTISSHTTSYTIPTRIIFCNHTGVCLTGSDNVLDYVLDSTCLNHAYFANIKLNLQPESCEYDLAESNIMHIRCDDCVPRPVVAVPSHLDLTSATTNEAEFTAVVSGIIPDNAYSYSFRSLNSNWPINLENMTGLFNSPTTTYCIESKLKFCENTGLCLAGSANILDFTLPEYCNLDKTHEARIVVDVNPLDCGTVVATSNIMHLTCDDCFPPDVTVSFNPMTLKTNKDTLNTVLAQVANLQENVVYSYNVSTLFSNWPFYINNQSGDIQTHLTYHDIPLVAAFCASTGVCPSGYKGVLDYTPESQSIVKRYAESNKVYAVLQVSIYEKDCPTKSYTSNRFVIECEDCQSSSSIPSVSIDIT
jgi:hypothetical protein